MLGTYNRILLLQRAIASIRTAVGTVPYQIVVIDGGSDDGSVAWLAEQDDVHLIAQEPPLPGVVAAFNAGFAWAVDEGFPYVLHLNDDAVVVSHDILARGIERIERTDRIGAVAYALDQGGAYRHDKVHGFYYANFALVRREAGMAVARAQGDPTGRAWWNPIYRSYGSDNEFSCWLHLLGWQLDCALDLRVHHDHRETRGDAVRVANRSADPYAPDKELFWRRWPSPEHIRRHGPCAVTTIHPEEERRAPPRR